MPKGSVALRDSKVGENVERIAGHILQPKHWKAFECYLECFSLEQVSKMTGTPTRTLYLWRNQDWWKELHQRFITSKQEEFYLQMCARAGDIIKGYFEVVTGQDKSDKTSSARVQAAKLFMEAGNNPLIKKHPAFVNINNTQVKVELDLKKLGELSMEELLEINLTGVIPEQLKIRR